MLADTQQRLSSRYGRCPPRILTHLSAWNKPKDQQGGKEMVSRLVLAVVGTFSLSILAVDPGWAVKCDPHCAPSSSHTNRGGETRGLNRANAVAGDHGAEGRAKAAAHQDAHKPGGSGVVSGETTTGSSGGSTGGTTDPVPPSTDPGPCSGC